ncbi:MAG: anti-sigma factor domain-containing protein, partial [Gemmataceae bacterium]
SPGAVAWNNARQEGYLRLDGLPPNDPRVSQYQLWIFDADRDERYPVDGGVFDVPAAGAVVPIRAKLGVGRPTLFAVTRERPGGVVVSDRRAVVLAAKVP